jgi:vacuolar-type H+-ATPase subunit F/Vma7
MFYKNKIKELEMEINSLHMEVLRLRENNNITIVKENSLPIIIEIGQYHKQFENISLKNLVMKIVEHLNLEIKATAEVKPEVVLVPKVAVKKHK